MNRLRTAVRRWLGITAIEDVLLNILKANDQVFNHIDVRLNRIENLVAAQSSGLGRIIGKLDPIYGRSEHDPERKAESDAIGEAVMKKLLAEHHARQHQEGKA